MSIKPNFTRADIEARFDSFLRGLDGKIIEQLQYLGEMCLTEARTNRGYTDDSGNLLSSTGYTIFKDGVAIFGAFAGDEKEGRHSGESLAMRVGSMYKNGFVLVFVAGMNYAVHVESKGRNVITSAEHLAEQEMPKILKDLRKTIQEKLR